MPESKVYSALDPKRDQMLADTAARMPEVIANQAPLAPMQEDPAQEFLGNAQAQIDNASIAQRERLENIGFVQGWQNAFSTTSTAHIINATLAATLGDEEDDPDWHFSTKEYNEIISTTGLQGSNHIFDQLAGTTSAKQALRKAEDLKRVQDTLQDLDGHGVKVFLANALDPIENLAMLATSAATVGTGAIPAVSARAARTIWATGQVGAMLGVMKLGEESGNETTYLDYLSTLAVGGLLSYAVAPKLLRKGPENAPDAPSAPRERTPDEVKVDDLKARTAKAEASTAPKAKAKAAKLRTELKAAEAKLPPEVKAARKVEVANVTRRADVEAQFRQEATPRAGQRLSRGEEKALTKELADLRFRLKAAGAAVAGRVEANLQDFSRKGVPARKAKQQAEAAAASETTDTVRSIEELISTAERKLTASLEAKRYQGQLDTLDSHGKLPPEWEAKVTGKQEVPLKEQVVTEAIETAAAVNPAKVVREIAEEAASTPEMATAAKQATEEATDIALQQRGVAGTSRKVAGKALTFFNELVSEYDKITAGIPALRKYMNKLMDDPLRRDRLHNASASSMWRQNTLLANNELKVLEDVLFDTTMKRTGGSKLLARFDFNGKHVDARLKLEEEVSIELLKREALDSMDKAVPNSSNPEIAKIIDLYEDLVHKSAQRAKDQGLAGMENYQRTKGYFHRSWDAEKINRWSQAYPEFNAQGQLIPNGFPIRMVTEAAKKGMPGLSDTEAKLIAHAVVTRTLDKARDVRSDFMGQLGKQETDNILEVLRAGDTDEVVIESIRRRLETKMQDQTGVKYVKDRIPLDMSVQMVAKDGRVISMHELIDTDLSRITANYQHSMAGRGALASVGIGGDEAGIATFRAKYAAELDNHKLSSQQKKAMLEQLDHILGDFTGVRPDGAVLSPTMATMKSLATASMLSSMGVLQIGEWSVVASRHGGANTFRHLLQQTPGIKRLLKNIGSDPKLYDEWVAVTGMDFSADTRMVSWKRQQEVGLTQDSHLQRIAYGMQEMAPTLTGQRWVHRLQSNMLINQNMHTIWKAANGDADALKLVQEFGNLTVSHLERIKAVARSEGGVLKEFGLKKLTDSELSAVTDTLTRLQDNLLLANRPGYGASYSRTAVGQLLGQFTSYVSMSQNLILRANYEHGGVAGVAAVLAYQYPMMLMLTYVNEARKGNVMDLEKDEDIMELAAKALTMSSVLGMWGDVAGVVSGNQSQRSVAAFGPLQAPGAVASMMGNLAQGEGTQAAGDMVQALNKLTFVGALPGSKLLENTLKDK